MVKKDIVKKIAEKHGDFTQKEIGMIIDECFDAIQESLVSGEKVQIYGFGTFDIKENAARERKIPSTGEIKMCPAYKSVKFRPASALKTAVKG